MSYLVTGDMGKLGSLVRAHLGARGYDLQRGEDILDYGKLVGAMSGTDVVVHCAGIPHPTPDPLPVFFKTNVQGTLNVCAAAVEAGVRRVVYFSSTAWYGCNAERGFKPTYHRVDEDHPPNPVGKRSAYGESKRMAESVLAWYGTNRLVETVALRCAPANPKSGQFPSGYNPEGQDDYRNKSLFANCHPDYAARAAVLAAMAPGPFWYEVFVLADEFMPECCGGGPSRFDAGKAVKVLGWEPCHDR